MSKLKHKLTFIKNQNPQIDVEHLMQVVNRHTPGHWIKPGSDYIAVFNELHEYHLVCKMIVPILNGGVFAGEKIYFFYSHDLEFTHMPELTT